MGVGGQRHALAALPPGKTWYPLYRRLSVPQGRSGRVRKISPPTEIRFLDRPASSESLYRLSYPGPHCYISRLLNFFLIIGHILSYVVSYEVGDTVLRIGYAHFHIILCQGGWVHVLVGDEMEISGSSSLH